MKKYILAVVVAFFCAFTFSSSTASAHGRVIFVVQQPTVIYQQVQQEPEPEQEVVPVMQMYGENGITYSLWPDGTWRTDDGSIVTDFGLEYNDIWMIDGRMWIHKKGFSSHGGHRIANMRNLRSITSYANTRARSGTSGRISNRTSGKSRSTNDFRGQGHQVNKMRDRATPRQFAQQRSLVQQRQVRAQQQVQQNSQDQKHKR